MLRGNSGAALTLQDGLVRKVAFGDGAKRLEASAAMQAAFRDVGLQTPQVLDRGPLPEQGYYLVMPYVAGSVPLLADSSCELAAFALADFVRRQLEASDYSDVTEAVDAKFAQVAQALREAPHVKGELRQCLQALAASRRALGSRVVLPLGATHGDLTFCNAIQAEDGLYVLDFAAQPVSTPLTDAVKLRQDTLHRWVTLFAPVPPYCLAKADAVVHAELHKIAAYREIGPAWDLFSLLRVAPYTFSSPRWRLLRREIHRAYTALDMRW